MSADSSPPKRSSPPFSDRPFNSAGVRPSSSSSSDHPTSRNMRLERLFTRLFVLPPFERGSALSSFGGCDSEGEAGETTAGEGETLLAPSDILVAEASASTPATAVRRCQKETRPTGDVGTSYNRYSTHAGRRSACDRPGAFRVKSKYGGKSAAAAAPRKKSEK